MGVNEIDNWNGPHATLDAAVDEIRFLAGSGKSAVWNHPAGIYINDGIDPDTGKEWAELPVGAYWIDVI